MNWSDRFNAFPMANLIGWCVICGVWLAWEIWGAMHAEGATFTYLVRSTVPKWGRWIAVVVLAWHFCFFDEPWWLSVVKIFK